MGALDRLSQLGGQISGGAAAGGKAKLLEKNPDDVRLAARSHARRYPHTLTYLSSDRCHSGSPDSHLQGRQGRLQGHLRG
jgi:hypothetical protein